MTGDDPPPLRPSGTHGSAPAAPPSLSMAHQGQHTTPPPIAPPRDSAGGGGGDDAATRALAPEPLRFSADGTPFFGPLDAHISGHTHPPSPFMAHRRQHTTPPPPIVPPRDDAGGSDGASPHASAPAHSRLTADGTPSPLRPLNAHIGGHTHLHSPSVAHQRQHTTPPIASPRDNAGGSEDVAPYALAPAPPRLTVDGTPSPLGPLDAHIGVLSHPPGPHVTRQQWRHTTAPPLASPRATGHVSDGDGTYLVPTRVAPPSAGCITSFLLRIRHGVADTTVDPAPGDATPDG